MENYNRRGRTVGGSASRGDAQHHPNAEGSAPSQMNVHTEGTGQYGNYLQPFQPDSRLQRLPNDPHLSNPNFQPRDFGWGLSGQPSNLQNVIEEDLDENQDWGLDGTEPADQRDIFPPAQPSYPTPAPPGPSRTRPIQPLFPTQPHQTDYAHGSHPSRGGQDLLPPHDAQVPRAPFLTWDPYQPDPAHRPYQWHNVYDQQHPHEPYFTNTPQHRWPRPADTGFGALPSEIPFGSLTPGNQQPRTYGPDRTPNAGLRQPFRPPTSAPTLDRGHGDPPTTQRGNTDAMPRQSGHLLPDRGPRRPPPAEAPEVPQSYRPLAHGTTQYRPPARPATGLITQFGLSNNRSPRGLGNARPAGENNNGPSRPPPRSRPDIPFPQPGQRLPIPVPQFASVAEARAYHRQTAEFTASMNRPRPCLQSQGEVGPSNTHGSERPQGAKDHAESSAPPAPKRQKRENGSGVRQGRISHGEVRILSDGSLRFRAWESRRWEHAIQHEQIRRAMLTDRSRLGSYTYEPTQGPGTSDRTAFHPAQRHWRFEGHHDWHNSQDAILYRFERGDLPIPGYTPGPLRFQHYVVLNDRNVPITDWRNMPLTISSMVEGGRMEQIQREDGRIANQDFRDRMPSRSGNRPTPGASALGNRKIAFRRANGLISWDRREGSERIRTLVRNNLSDEQRAANTTRGFDGLTDAELQSITDENRRTGHFQARGIRKPKEKGDEKKASKSAVGGKRKRDEPKEEEDDDDDDDDGNDGLEDEDE